MVRETLAPDTYFHNLAKEFDVNPFRLGGASTSIGFGGRGYENPSYVYVRDYFPLQIRRPKDGRMQSVFITYSSFIYRGRDYLFLAPYPKGDPPTASSKFLIFERMGEKLEFWAEVKHLPLFIEGGNIIAMPHHVFIGRKILEMNSRTESELVHSFSHGQEGYRIEAEAMVRNARERGWQTRSAEESLRLMAEIMEIPVERFVVMDSLPLERTQHVDMFMGMLGKNTVVMPKIPEEVIQHLDYAHERHASNVINEWLMVQQQKLSDMGLEVLRIPMLSPKNLVQAQNEWGYDAKILSPVNWLIQGDKVLVPTFSESFKHIPAEIAQSMHREIEDVLFTKGFKVEFVEAEKLAKGNGMLHCISAQYDLSEFR